MRGLSRREILIIENLKVYYKTSEGGFVKAVDGVSLKLFEGEAFCLVGETGCGKSTLGYAIMKLLPPNAKILDGKILYNGRDLVKASEDEMRKIRGKELAMIFQNPMSSLNPTLTIGTQISEVPVTHLKISWKEAWSYAIDLLRKVKIPDPDVRIKSYPHTFSGGMRQRSMIAMMTSCAPKLLIADEPTTALDVTVQAQILELLASLKEEQSMTLLLITHNFGIVAKMCDRVGVMYAGKLVEVADVDEIFENPLHPYTKGLIGCVVSRRIPKSKLPQIPGSPPNLLSPPSGCRFNPRCTQVLPICKEIEPQLFKLSKNHYVACHHYRAGVEGFE